MKIINIEDLKRIGYIVDTNLIGKDGYGALNLEYYYKKKFTTLYISRNIKQQLDIEINSINANIITPEKMFIELKDLSEEEAYNKIKQRFIDIFKQIKTMTNNNIYLIIESEFKKVKHKEMEFLLGSFGFCFEEAMKE